ncbi:hypothetical protein QAD02_016101 [Eretmocerus hayati]|uniref:Uncharacterized protein n=1 Tax=Eretmocerus hayati TaxID=131215 RepID=A0ACC2PCK4_9HYME|nr:hypothetical protein QAD02_016101 [Eretmocerus hayati]
MNLIFAASKNLLLNCLVLFGTIKAADIAKDFSQSALVPDVIPKAPTEILAVSFKDSNDKEKDLKYGEELTPTLVKTMPSLNWYTEDSAHYLIAMIDPDAPRREDPKYREYLHWLVANVPGNGDISKGETIVEYLGSAPPKDTGLHRYAIMVYKQPDKLTIEEAHIKATEATGRPGFTLEKFAAKYKLGDPVAGNVFFAQYDEYVDIVQKQLGEKS